jgi:uncharacterized protein (UPF0332 family)
LTDSGVRRLMDKAAESLDAARLLLSQGYADFSASRTYYAMFYAVEALLLAKNMAFSKHSAVISAFGRHFVKEGIFDEKYHGYLIDAFDLRNLGDYGTGERVETIKAEELIRQAAEFIYTIDEYITRHTGG